MYADFLSGRPGRLALWDLSSATVAKIDSEGIRDLAKCMAQMGSGRRHGGKTAIAAGLWTSAWRARPKANSDIAGADERQIEAPCVV